MKGEGRYLRSFLAVFVLVVLTTGCGSHNDGGDVTNSDNDAAGITVNQTSGLVTTEDGGAASFTVVLNTEPRVDVSIGISSSDTTEGSVDKASLTFTGSDWSTPQTVTVIGLGDDLTDGSVSYTIVTTAANSSDPNYSGVDAPDVEVTNSDTTPVVLIVSDSNGDIWQVNQSNGTVTELLDVFINVTSNIGAISSMVYDAGTGKIFAGTGGEASCNGCIYTIDPSTGEATLFLDPAIYAIPAMAIRSDGTIFASYEDDLGNTSLYSIDPPVAVDTLIGTLDVGSKYGHDLTFDISDTLYLGDRYGLGIINQDTAEINPTRNEYTFSNSSSLFREINPDFHISSYDHNIRSMLTFPSDGQTFAIFNDADAPAPNFYRSIVKADLSSANLTFVGELSRTLDGLAFAPVNAISNSIQPFTPTNVAAVSAPLSVGVSWDKVFAATSYNVYWSTSSGVSPSIYDGVATDITDPFFNNPGTVGTTYYLIMTAVRNGVEGAASDEVSAIAGGSKGYQFIGFAPENGPFANTIAIDDDAKSAALPIGFSFDFFDGTYTEFVIFSNGFITFDTAASNTDDSYLAHSIPVNDAWNNIIALAWVDLSPDLSGTISYETLGTAPDRRLVVNFEDVTYYGGTTGANVSTQAILYESSNVVEIHTTYQDSCLSSDGEFQSGFEFITQGVENADGTEAIFVPGRVTSDYGLTNDAVRFYTNNL